jgi:hypothetical protein
MSWYRLNPSPGVAVERGLMGPEPEEMLRDTVLAAVAEVGLRRGIVAAVPE